MKDAKKKFNKTKNKKLDVYSKEENVTTTFKIT
jgi:hypothetical protein